MFLKQLHSQRERVSRYFTHANNFITNVTINGNILLIGMLVAMGGGLNSHAQVTDLNQSGCGKKMILAQEGKPFYTIVIGDQAGELDKTAAKILQTNLKEITGADFMISQESKVSKDAPQILIGRTKRVDEVCPGIDWNRLKDDGIFIKTVGQCLVLTGGRKRGSIYAVYDFLENVVGCRWWTSTAKTIPHKTILQIPALDITYVPQLVYREVNYAELRNNPEFAVALKINGHFENIPARYGGHYAILGWCHTSFKLLPPAKYFARHPEWYSEINGKRQAKRGQLCFTNEAMRKELVKHALQWINNNPHANMISISQQDNGAMCQCAKCSKLAKYEGSQAGPLLHFINKVAGDIAKQHPDIKVVTLAYQSTIKPPKHVKPAPNVIIRLCSERCSFSRPLDDKSNLVFQKEIRAWKKLTSNLFIWDYVSNFSNRLIPHPNLSVLAPNIRFFIKNNAVGIFEQGGTEDSLDYIGDFPRLKAWMLAHLMWNPQLNDKKLITTFLNGYYGKAGEYILAYLNLLNDAFKASGRQLYMWNGRNPFAMYSSTLPYLSLEQMNNASQLYRKAELSVVNDPELSMRVRRNRLPFDLLWIIHYNRLKRESEQQKQPFFGPADYSGAIEDYIQTAQKFIPGKTPNALLKKIESYLKKGIQSPGFIPAPYNKLPRNKVAYILPEMFSILGYPNQAGLTDDPKSRNGKVIYLETNHRGWVVQFQRIPMLGLSGKWRCIVYARIKAKSNMGRAFNLGVYDRSGPPSVFSPEISIFKPGEYTPVDCGVHDFNKKSILWLSPRKNPDQIEKIFIERVILIKETPIAEKMKTTVLPGCTNIQGESLLLAKTIPAKLCFDNVLKGSLVLRSTYMPGGLVYKKGIDYVVDYEAGTIARTRNSRIPDYSTNCLYGQKKFNHSKFPGFGNRKWYVWVDYQTTNGKQWAKPNDQSEYLKKVRRKLETGGPFTVVFYGDSITAGSEASKLAHRFSHRFVKYLQSKFPKAKIKLKNVSIPGYCSKQGVDWFDKKFANIKKADLVLVGFGMNDHNTKWGQSPEQFKANLKKIVKLCRERVGADVILFSSFPPNTDWIFSSHRMEKYAEATKQAAAESKCAYANVYDTWKMVLQRKDQSSLLNNNINHPNDFGHWLYEQAFEAMKF